VPASVINQIVNTHRAQLQGIIELGGVRKVRSLYEQARLELEDKLAHLRAVGQGQTFSAHHLRMILVQVMDGLRGFQADLAPELSKQARHAADLAQHHLTTSIKRMESQYSGMTPSLRIEEAAVFDRVYRGVEPTLLHRYQKLVGNYPMATIERVRKSMALGLIQGENTDRMVDRVAGAGGIFDREKWRAERIVRTECLHAYGVANQRCLEETAQEVPGLMKRLVATFDVRTGKDSIQLNGQAVPVDRPFVWMKQTKAGVERVEYMAPPNRPNDREVVIPWRVGYPEPKAEPGPVHARMPSL
jgi:hypothetical protein